MQVGAHAEELEVADLQTQHESVVIPITMISHASFRSRAIVFKAICDIFGIPCSLERGEYRKTWNVVLLQSKKLQVLNINRNMIRLCIDRNNILSSGSDDTMPMRV